MPLIRRDTAPDGDHIVNEFYHLYNVQLQMTNDRSVSLNQTHFEAVLEGDPSRAHINENSRDEVRMKFSPRDSIILLLLTSVGEKSTL